MIIISYLKQYNYLYKQRQILVLNKGWHAIKPNNKPILFHDAPLTVFLGPGQKKGLLAFANGPGDLGSIPGRVIPKTQKMVLDASLLNTQHYKVRIKGKVEQSWERSSALPYTFV